MTEVPKEKQTELEAEATRLTTKAASFKIFDASSHRTAISGIDQAKQFQQEVKAVWDPVCVAANTAHKAATKGRADQIAPFVAAEKKLKALCNEYDLEQERLRREEQDRIDKEERDRADENRKKEEDALAKATALEAAGKTEEAEAVVEAVVEEVAAPIPAPVIQTPDVPKGVTYIDHWVAEIIEPNLVPRQYCVPDQAALNKHAKENKGQIPIPGVKFVNDRTIRR